MSNGTERPGRARDPVRELVRLAGERPAVPADRLARVRAASRVAWDRQTLRRRRLRRRVAGLAAVAAALALVVALRLLSPLDRSGSEPQSAAVVESLDGVAWMLATTAGAAGERQELTVGATVPPGARLITADDGRVALRLGSGHSLRLDTATGARWNVDGSVELERGGLYVDSGARGPHEGTLEVRTPLGVVREIGTRFEVRLEQDSVRVRLREGAVVVRQDGKAHEVGIGTELELDRDGFVVRRAISTHGPAWDWTAAVVPVPELEGRTAREFLGWYARERGLTLAFSDEGAARSAERIVLGGGGERLSIDEALVAVLETCRMRHRVDDGILLISEAAGRS